MRFRLAPKSTTLNFIGISRDLADLGGLCPNIVANHSVDRQCDDLNTRLIVNKYELCITLNEIHHP